jgi:hypothetical protein
LFETFINFLKKCKSYVWKKYKAAFALVSWTIASKIFFYLSTSCAQLIRLGEKRANSYMKNPWISNDQGVGESMIKYLSQVNAYISVYKLWWLIFFNIDILPTVSKSNKNLIIETLLCGILHAINWQKSFCNLTCVETRKLQYGEMLRSCFYLPVFSVEIHVPITILI